MTNIEGNYLLIAEDMDFEKSLFFHTIEELEGFIWKNDFYFFQLVNDYSKTNPLDTFVRLYSDTSKDSVYIVRKLNKRGERYMNKRKFNAKLCEKMSSDTFSFPADTDSMEKKWYGE